PRERTRGSVVRVGGQPEIEGVDRRRAQARALQRVGDDARAHALAEAQDEVALAGQQSPAGADALEEGGELGEVAVQELGVEPELPQEALVADADAVAVDRA